MIILRINGEKLAESVNVKMITNYIELKINNMLKTNKVDYHILDKNIDINIY